ncbi:MAG: YjbQ family protein [Cytophagales bacterium]|nr:YjbQ family protein [Cytophaga sp.]
MVFQHTFELVPYPRGFHLITAEAEKQLKKSGIQKGIAQLFIHHTSASLTINENADPSVRQDFERHFNAMIPENAPYFRHTQEGSDDMPAHIKASLLGSSVQLPVKDGRFLTGIWQGIYLCEHRNLGGARTLTLTVLGE